MRRIYGDKIKVYFFSILVIAALVAFLRVVTLIFNYDPIIGYYNGGFAVTIMNAVCVLGCLWGLSVLFLIPKTCPCEDICPRSNMVALYFCSFVFLADALYSFAGMISSSDFFAPFEDLYAARTDKVLAVMAILGALASLATAVCLFRRASRKESKGIDILFGFVTLLRMLSGIFTVYFDMEVPMNNSHKMLIEWALITSMVFVLQENRFFAPVKKRPRAYLAFGFVAMILTASAGIGGLFSYFSGLLLQGSFCIESLICLTMFVHISASVVSYVKQFDDIEQIADEGDVSDAVGESADPAE
jgi:hypothetical protein